MDTNMKISYRGFLYEAKSIPTKWYHGTNVDFEKFDSSYAYIENKSLARYGPGFYLTTSLELAKHYGNIIKVVELEQTSKIYFANSKPRINFAKIGVNNIPKHRVEDILSNWDIDMIKARSILLNSLINQPDLGEQVQSIWYDCFRGYELEFMKTFSSFCDGVLFEVDNAEILIGYNPSTLKIVDTIQVKEDNFQG